MSSQHGFAYAYEATALSRPQLSAFAYAYEQTGLGPEPQSGRFYAYEATAPSVVAAPQDGYFYATENTIDQTDPTQIKVWDGSQWVRKPFYEWDGTNWQQIS